MEERSSADFKDSPSQKFKILQVMNTLETLPLYSDMIGDRQAMASDHIFVYTMTSWNPFNSWFPIKSGV